MSVVLGIFIGLLIGILIMMPTVNKLNMECLRYQEVILGYQRKLIELLNDRLNLLITLAEREIEEEDE